MKLLNAHLENGYLVIETDLGRRRRKIDERENAQALLIWAQGFIGKYITTTTWDDWNPQFWFGTISLAKDSPSSPIKTESSTVSKQNNTSIDELLRNAEAGDMAAQFLVAKIFELGINAPKNLTKAVHWYQKAANQGHTEAAIALGIDPIPAAKPVDSREVTKIYGPPGTGKTTTLINIVMNTVRDGIQSDDIGYFSYTNQATQEAKKRITQKFPNLDQTNDFPYFQTLHSLAYKSLRTNLNLLTEKEALAFDKNVTIERPLMREDDESSRVVRVKHPIIDAASTARAIKQTLQTYLENLRESQRWPLNKWLGGKFNDWQRPLSTDAIKEIIAYNERYERYKSNLGVIDYADILDRVIVETKGLPKLAVLIIDEAQDLTPIQWDLVRLLISNAKKTFIAGDDDQAICEAFGARASEFVSLKSTQADIVLDISHRVPSSIHSRLTPLIEKLNTHYPYRKQKAWQPKDQKDSGTITIHHTADPVIDLISKNHKKDDTTIYIIAPTNVTLKKFSTILKSHSIDHFLSNEAIGANPRNIKLQTTWGAKGGEADIAILINEGDADYKMLLEDPRLEYVAITRAKRDFIYLQLHKSGKNPFTCTPKEKPSRIYTAPSLEQINNLLNKQGNNTYNTQNSQPPKMDHKTKKSISSLSDLHELYKPK